MTQQKMQALFVTRYGSADVLQLQTTDRPEPKPNELLVRTIAGSVTRADTMMRSGTPYYARLFLGLRRPRNPIAGTGFSGEVVAVGKEVKNFQVGDAVFGETAMGFSANAEYLTVPETGVVLHKPENLPHGEAATFTDGALTSLSFLKDIGKLKPGQSVLINGASGGLGTAAVQLARIMDARVTGVASTRNLELLRDLGADRVIDYTRQDPVDGSEKYDLIFDTVGKLRYSHAKDALKPGGKFLSPVLSLGLLFQMIRTSLFGTKKALFSATGMRPAAELKPLLEELRTLAATGRLRTHIDRSYPLAEGAEAHRYVDGGHKVGNVVLTVAGTM